MFLKEFKESEIYFIQLPRKLLEKSFKMGLPSFLPIWQKILTGAGNTVRKEVGGTLRSDEGVNGVTSRQKEGGELGGGFTAEE